MGFAILSNDNNYTIFKYEDFIIRFKSPYSLVKYIHVKHWDNGYIEVLAKYTHIDEVVEYIDLMPILEDLYFEPNDFLKNIQEVKISYD